MSDMIDLNAAKMQVKNNKFGKWIKENYWMVLFTILFLTGAYSIIGSAAQHKYDVLEISKQNAACIYLESSKLGEGQHYMICNGQIVLKRLSDQTVEQTTPEEKLEEVVPTEAANTSAPTPPTK